MKLKRRLTALLIFLALNQRLRHCRHKLRFASSAGRRARHRRAGNPIALDLRG